MHQVTIIRFLLSCVWAGLGGHKGGGTGIESPPPARPRCVCQGLNTHQQHKIITMQPGALSTLSPSEQNQKLKTNAVSLTSYVQ